MGENERLERVLEQLVERVRRLEVWQAECRVTVRELENLLGRYIPIVDAMRQADAIADAVAGKLESRDERSLRVWGIRAAIAGAILAGAGELVTAGFRIFGAA